MDWAHSLPRMAARFRAVPPLIYLLIVMTLGVALVPFAHVMHAALFMDEIGAFADWRYWRKFLLIFHILFSLPAIFFGPLLFIAAYRNAYPGHHRWMGQWYVIGCLGGAVTVLPLSLTNAGGVVARFGFTIMAVLWFLITWLAYMAARRYDFTAHRRWMMRSYAMSFAFVHVNLTYHWIGVYDGGLSPAGIKVMQSLVSWIANLAVVECYLAATTFDGRFVGFRRWGGRLCRWSPEDRCYWRPPPAAGPQSVGSNQRMTDHSEA